MGEFHTLRDLVILFAVAVAVVVLLHRLRLPAIAGFLVAGAIAGPAALGLIPDRENVEQLAELGVIALLFGIGLELPVSKLRKLWRPVLICGSMQMALTMVAAFGVARFGGVAIRPAVLIGGVIAVSSTAIVLRALQDRAQVDAPHGRNTLSVLVFQDLCVVPLMMLIPFLAGEGGGIVELGGAFGRAAAVLVLVLLLGRGVVRVILKAVARTRQQSLFVLTVLVICLGTAWLAATAGVSLALGAFLAGMVVADSEYRHQALSDLIPFREAFTSLFFLSVGMLLDPVALLGDIAPVSAMVGAVIVGKFVVMMVVCAALRLPLRVAVLMSTALAQIGEFSFLLLDEASGHALLEPRLASQLLAAAVLSMLLTPFVIAFGPRLADWSTRSRILRRIFLRPEPAEVRGSADGLSAHVIIGGYGLTGQELARALQECGTPFVIVDLNPDNVARARAAGQKALFGDVTSPVMLERLGATRALQLVLAVNDPNAAELAVRTVHEAVPELSILVRVPFLADVEAMRRAGATTVVPMELEGAAEVVARVLRHAGAKEERVNEVLDTLHARHGCADPDAPAPMIAQARKA